jgi:deoxyribodipyrimidine photo-lyase
VHPIQLNLTRFF